MTLRRLIHPTNRRVRLLVGILLAGLFCIQCSRTEAFRQSRFVVAISGQAVGENDAAVMAHVKHLAQTDHITLLEYCLANYEGRFRNYTCTMIKQERINQVVGKEQEIHVKFMEEPYSVAMAWTPETAPIGDRALYAQGRYNNQMLVRPNGVLNQLVGTVMRPPDGPEARRSTLRPINQFGFRRSMESLLKVYRKARSAGDLKEAFGGYAEVGGREAIALVRYLPAKDDYPAARTVIFLDLEYLVPIAVEGYDWDGKLACRYVYKDLAFNVGLTSSDFLPAANGMAPPK
jgi:hypothetical protein